jgi:hypothetical protein
MLPLIHGRSLSRGQKVSRSASGVNFFWFFDAYVGPLSRGSSSFLNQTSGICSGRRAGQQRDSQPLQGWDVVTRPRAYFQPGVVHHFDFNLVVSARAGPCQIIAQRVLRA